MRTFAVRQQQPLIDRKIGRFWARGRFPAGLSTLTVHSVDGSTYFITKQE